MNSIVPIVLRALTAISVSSSRSAAPVRKVLEQLDGLPHVPLGFGRAAGTPEDHRQPAKRVAFPEPVAQLPVHLQRVLDRLDRLVGLIRQVALVRAPLQELRLGLDAEPVRESKRSRVLGGGFPMRAERSGAVAGGGRVPEDGINLLRGVGVVGEPRKIEGSARRILEDGQRLAVQGEASVRIDRLLDGESRELVPEGDRVVLVTKHSRRETLVELAQRAVGKDL